MNNGLWEQLSSHFGIQLQQEKEAVCTLTGAELTDREAMRHFLTLYSQLIEGEDLSVGAAYFGSWFGDLAAALLYSLAIHRAAPQLPISNLTVHLIQEKNFVRIAFQLAEDEVLAADNWTDWQAWREEIFRRFYSETVQPLFAFLSEASGIKAAILWGQLPTALQNYREKLHGMFSAQGMDKELSQLAESDNYMCHVLAPEVFGLRRNPFQVKVRFLDHPLAAGQKLAIKNTCCLQYKRTNRSYCYTCPRVTVQERANWKF
ncbi:IucA/IucC family C-terminal-domain containing protein [Paenibacillus sp. NPDC058174]|uniref:IucA/IucC family C-terminal-domain containing protein n=1 Tax=Paenibacillus sp. NPDC058174 TaxID=3346366 RepID=UPI0036D95757